VRFSVSRFAIVVPSEVGVGFDAEFAIVDMPLTLRMLLLHRRNSRHAQ
jgi:hypothetical protein